MTGIEQSESNATRRENPSKSAIQLGPERNPGADGAAAASPEAVAVDAAQESACGTDDEFPLKNIKIGAQDKRGRKIIDVLWAVNDFKIYKTSWGINPHFSDAAKTAKDQREWYLALGSELSHLNHLIQLMEPWLMRMGRLVLRRVGKDPAVDATGIYYEREMARAIAQALTGDVEKAKTDLTVLAERLEKRVRNRGRVIYFGMCLLLATCVVGLAAILLPVPDATLSSEVTLAAMMGSIGALLSTAVGLRSLTIDASATLFMNLVYGGQRMLVGVLGAIVVYLALRAGIALEVFPGVGDGSPGDGPLDRYKLAFISLLAGFSERLVPNLLDRNGDTEGG